jgi:uncharacterized membrane protein
LKSKPLLLSVVEVVVGADADVDVNVNTGNDIVAVAVVCVVEVVVVGSYPNWVGVDSNCLMFNCCLCGEG